MRELWRGFLGRFLPRNAEPAIKEIPESDGAWGTSPLRRFSIEELEIACIEAHTCGRVYTEGGEKRMPGDEHWNMLNRSLRAVDGYRRARNKDARKRKPLKKAESDKVNG